MPREAAPADDGPPLFRPSQRPATPTLLVFDDGSEEGELIRIRQEKFVIGRSEGDLVIGHDSQISGRHAELRHVVSKDKQRWHLVDLKSTNGTYVRIGHALLDHGQEFIVGRTRLRFENPHGEKPSSTPPSNPGDQPTRPWHSAEQHPAAPSIVEVTAKGDGPRIVVSTQELWLGKDASYCRIVLANDPFASTRHARLFRDEEGRWTLKNNQSLNGVWLRIERLSLKGTCRFLIGEQQFMFRIPG